MYVKRILLQNYRNYESLNLDLTRNVNILCGQNAQGKTNLLEAIYFCATGRSHRTAYDRECIRAGEEEALIKILYEKHRDDTVEIDLRKNGRKSVAVNGFPVKKIDDLFGCFHVVVFSPEDLSLIKSGPARRRKFMDIEICQLDAVYLHNLQQYHKVLKQRNQLLKDLYRNPFRGIAYSHGTPSWQSTELKLPSGEANFYRRWTAIPGRFISNCPMARSSWLYPMSRTARRTLSLCWIG